MRRLSFYNEWHLGDCVFNINYINRLFYSNEIERVDYYLREDHIKQIGQFVIEKDKVFLHPLHGRPAGAVNLWIGQDRFVFRNRYSTVYDLMYVDFWTYVSNKAGVVNPITSSQQNLILLGDQPAGTPDFDVLFINSTPMSGQAVYDQSCYSKIADHFLQRSLKVCTTSALRPDIYCSLSDYLSIYDLAHISTKCKYVIGIHTGPFIGALNDQTLNNVRNYIVYDRQNHFSYDKYVACRSNEELLESVRRLI